MKACPFGMFQLPGQKSDGAVVSHLVQRKNQRARADDPEHVKPAQSIHGYHSLAYSLADPAGAGAGFTALADCVAVVIIYVIQFFMRLFASQVYGHKPIDNIQLV